MPVKRAMPVSNNPRRHRSGSASYSANRSTRYDSSTSRTGAGYTSRPTANSGSRTSSTRRSTEQRRPSRSSYSNSSYSNASRYDKSASRQSIGSSRQVRQGQYQRRRAEDRTRSSATHATTARSTQRQPKKGVMSTIGRGFSFLWGKSRIACVIAVALIVGAAGFGVEELMSAGHIRQGVKIGDVDVSGMTAQEAQNAVIDKYEENLHATTAFIFDSQETAQAADIDDLLLQEDALAEQISLEDSRSSKQMWVANAETLSASLPTEQLVDEAMSLGRGLDLFDRASAALFGHSVPLRLDYSEESLSSLIEDINATLGEIRVDWGIKVEDGMASVTEGNDGSMLDEPVFIQQLTDQLLADRDERKIMLAELVFTPMRIDQQGAQLTCDAVNSAIREGATFTYDGKALETPADMMGEWIFTEVSEHGNGYLLMPYLSVDDASKSIATSLTVGETGSGIAVRFQVSDGGDVSVIPDSEVIIPSVGDAVRTLDDDLFGAFRETGMHEAQGNRFDIPIQTKTAEGPFTFDEACANGIITNIGSYTTSYTDTKSTQNRNSNIRLASDTLSNSVIERNGGGWSFSALVGECTPEKGYKDANNIVNGEIVAAPGGGVCQVSTTVFNAVYESGFPVDQRYNHSLRMSSYPDGRDAAIAYPIKDLKWSNDSGSDVLLRMSYTNTTVTATLYGVSPGYSVKTTTGDWVEGEKFKTKVKVDNTKPEGYKKTETMGTDGVSIYVIRTVTDENGNVVRKDRFDSVYSPVNKVIVTGPNTPVDLEEESKKNT